MVELLPSELLLHHEHLHLQTKVVILVRRASSVLIQLQTVADGSPMRLPAAPPAL